MIVENLIENSRELSLVNRSGTKLFVANLETNQKLDNNPRSIALALLYQNLLLAGTKTTKKAELAAKLNLLGASFSVDYPYLTPTFKLAVLASELKSLLKILTDIRKESTFSPAEIKIATKTLTGLMALEEDNARAKADNNLKNALYTPDSDFYRPSSAEISVALKTIKRSELLALHNLLFTSIALVTVGGDSVEQKNFRTYLKSWPLKESNKKRQAKLPYVAKPKSFVTEDVPSKQNIEVSIGGILPLTLEDPEFPAFYFGLSVLAKWGGFSGRLMSIIREKEGLTYSIYGRTEGATRTRPGHWRIMTFFAPNDLEAGLKGTKREIARLANDGITESEFKRFKDILKTSEVLLYDSLLSLVGAAATQKHNGFTFSEYLTWRQKLYSVTQKEVNQAVKKYLAAENIVISLAGPLKKVDPKVLKSKF